MTDITIPDAAMEAAAHAMFEVTGEPDWTAMEIRQVVEAAAPYIAAQALEDFADAHRMPWTMFLREDGSPVTVGDLMRETAARYRIEADHG